MFIIIYDKYEIRSMGESESTMNKRKFELKVFMIFMKIKLSNN